MAYSIDLRIRVISFVESGGSLSEAARRFEINRSTVYEWLHLKQETASLSKRLLVRNARKISRDVLIQRICENPDMLLREHAAYFGVRVQSISMALQDSGITRKKRHRSTKNEMRPKEQSI
jgi:putative transposase